MHSTTAESVPFPPDPNPRKPRVDVPPGSWDTHFHIYGPPHRFPYAETRRFTPPAAPIEHWQRVSAALGIERGVLVMPAVHGSDTAVIVDAIARSDGRIRAVIRSEANPSAREVERLHRAGVRGLRFTFTREHGGDFDVQTVAANVARIESLGWSAAFLIDDDMLETHADLLGSLPLPTILDSFAGIQPDKGLKQSALRTLLDLLRTPNVFVKLMIPDRLLAQGQKYSDIVAVARAIVDHAPDRVIWGSDWPHSYIYEATAMPNDGDLIDMLLDFAPDAAVRAKIFVETPRRLFDF